MCAVKAGIMLSNQQFEGADMVSALEEQLVMLRLARDRGWDSYFCGQHYLNEGGNQGAAQVIVFNQKENMLEGGVDRRPPDGGAAGK